MSLHIVAVITAKEDKVEVLHEQLHKLVAETLTEPACLQYELHQDVNSKNIFIMLEEWKSEDGIQIHSQSKHFLEFLKNSEALFLKPLLAHITVKA
jgi:quinol monooxygenase YgiN